MATLRCSEQFDQSRIQCGEQKDNFILSIRLKHPEATCATIRMGYRSYYKALWSAQRSKRCEHSLQAPQEIRLPPDTMTVQGYDGHHEVDKDVRIVILLTARNRFARWRALLVTMGKKR